MCVSMDITHLMMESPVLIIFLIVLNMWKVMIQMNQQNAKHVKLTLFHPHVEKLVCLNVVMTKRFVLV